MSDLLLLVIVACDLLVVMVKEVIELEIVSLRVFQNNSTDLLVIDHHGDVTI